MPKTPTELRAIPDPVERIRETNIVMDVRRAELADLAVITREAVQEMHRELGSHAAVAKVLGVTRARAQQLVNPPPSKRPARQR